MCVCGWVWVYLCSVYVVAFRESRLYVGWCVLMFRSRTCMVQYADRCSTRLDLETCTCMHALVLSVSAY